MADKKFTDLGAVVLLSGNEVIPSVQAGVDLYTTPDQITTDVVKTDVDIADAISKKHSNALDHTQGTDQHLDFGGLNVVTVADVKDAVTKKHSNALDHTQGTDQGLDFGGASAVIVSDIKDAVTKKHTAYSDAETATTIIALGIDEIEFSVIKSYMI